MSGPPAGIGGMTLEVEAKARQALRRSVREDDPVPRQEPVRVGVVDHLDERVQARVTAVAGVRVQPRPRRRQRVSTGGAAAARARRDDRRGRAQPGSGDTRTYRQRRRFSASARSHPLRVNPTLRV